MGVVGALTFLAMTCPDHYGLLWFGEIVCVTKLRALNNSTNNVSSQGTRLCDALVLRGPTYGWNSSAPECSDTTTSLQAPHFVQNLRMF